MPLAMIDGLIVIGTLVVFAVVCYVIDKARGRI
jgi:preprotein translocase subunit SecE